MRDLIDRQAAINGKISIQRANGLEIYYDEVVPVEYLKRLPSAQAEIIRCKDCEWWDSESKEKYRVCHKHNTGWKEDDYCSFADMREGDAK